MNKAQALFVQARFRSLPAWASMEAHHPKFAEAVSLLPDETGMSCVCQELRCVFEDAKKEAEIIQ